MGEVEQPALVAVRADGVSTVAKVTLFALFRAAAEAASGSPPPAGQSYRAAKDRSADYAAARALLLGDFRLFGGWLRADPALEAFPAPPQLPKDSG